MVELAKSGQQDWMLHKCENYITYFLNYVIVLSIKCPNFGV